MHVIISWLGILSVRNLMILLRKICKTSCRSKITFSSWTFSLSKLLTGRDVKKQARVDKAWTTHLFGMFLDARMSFLIVHIQEIV